jgi:hypothetical protein
MPSTWSRSWAQRVIGLAADEVPAMFIKASVHPNNSDRRHHVHLTRARFVPRRTRCGGGDGSDPINPSATTSANNRLAASRYALLSLAWARLHIQMAEGSEQIEYESFAQGPGEGPRQARRKLRLQSRRRRFGAIGSLCIAHHLSIQVPSRMAENRHHNRKSNEQRKGPKHQEPSDY